MSGVEVAQTGPDDGLFARQATGLVREVSVANAFFMNWILVFPPLVLAVSVFWTLSVFVGANLYLAFAMAVLLAIPILFAVGTLSSAIPRSGGDYVLVSRVLGPYVGMASSFFTLATFTIAGAFIALSATTLGLGPVLAALSLITGSGTLSDWATTLGTDKTWQFVVSLAFLLLATLPHALGWRVGLRFLTWGFLFAVGGFGLIGLVLLFTSSGGFSSSFNDVATPVTDNPNTYNSFISSATEAGFDLSPGFSLSSTWPALGAVLGFLGPYCYQTIYVAGELRRGAAKRNPQIMLFSVVASGAVIAIYTLLFFSSFGGEFFRAANIINGTPDYPFATPPMYVFFAMIAANSSVLAWIIGLAFVAAFPMLLFLQLLAPIRVLFAYAFDGVLPFRVSHVTPGKGAPVFALLIAVVATIGALAWAVWTTSFFTVLAFIVLFQLLALTLLCVAGALMPYRKTELWRATTGGRTIAGVPAITVGGVVGLACAFFIMYLYLHYEGLGIASNWVAFRAVLIVGATGMLAFALARFIRSRQGFELNRVYTEIPPE